MIKVALADPDQQFVDEIELLFQERPDMTLVATAKDLNHALAVTEEQRPDVLLIGPGIGAELSIAFVRKLTAQHPVGCIIFTFTSPAYHKQAAMRANVVEVLQIPVDPEKLVSAVQMAAGYAQQLAIKEETANAPHRCAVLTVFSTKGGVGKTMLATNMATAIASTVEARVVLVDLDLQFGDVGIVMGLRPEITILHFADAVLQADTMMLDELLTQHDSGVRVLMAPKEPESADLITGTSVTSIMSILKQYADFIIVDTPASFNDNVLAVLDQSDEICLVLTLDMPAVKNIKVGMKTLDELRYDSSKLKMVVNKVESNIGLKVSEIEKVLGMRALAEIAADKAISLSINKGVPVVLDAPKLPVSKEIADIALFYVNKYRSDLMDTALVS